MKLNRMFAAAAITVALPTLGDVELPQITTTWSYQTADGGKAGALQKKTVMLPSGNRTLENFTSDPKMSKTLLLLNVVDTLKNALAAYAKPCDAQPVQVYPRYEIPEPGQALPRPRPPEPDCRGTRHQVADRLQSAVAALETQLRQDPGARDDRTVVEALDYARKLARNMEKAPEPITYPKHVPHLLSPGAPAVTANVRAVAGASLNVTSGAAQGYDQFKKIVDAGSVPSSDVLPVDGFLKEFDLSLTENPCEQTLCVSPAVTVDGAAKKMYVQISMGSNVRPETFKRKPLNLSVVVDISGSMGQDDGTGKSRLEWAKEGLNRIVDQLSADDYLSIVVFDDVSEVLREPASVTDRKAIQSLVAGLHTRNSTDLGAGMRDGLRLVYSKLAALPGYEHRVITISDAGANSGITDEASFVRLVTNYANDGIGVTVLGVGDDFQAGLVQGFAMTKGGNFQHAQSGLAMLKFFENFDYLVTPVAYNFRANLALKGVNAKFSRAYGVPVKEGQPLDELINLQTLFFSTGGGAIVLEYSLP